MQPRLPLVLLFALLFALPCLAADPVLKSGVEFSVPLTDGTTAPAVFFALPDGKPVLAYVYAGHFVLVPISASTPTPTPPGPPTPTPTPGPLGDLRGKVKGWLTQIPTADRVIAPAIAKQYRAAAAQIAAGTLKTPDDAMSALRDGLKPILAPKIQSWSAFVDDWAKAVNDLSDSGQLGTMDQHQLLFTETAIGLGG